MLFQGFVLKKTRMSTTEDTSPGQSPMRASKRRSLRVRSTGSSSSSGSIKRSSRGKEGEGRERDSYISESAKLPSVASIQEEGGNNNEGKGGGGGKGVADGGKDVVGSGDASAEVKPRENGVNGKGAMGVAATVAVTSKGKEGEEIDGKMKEGVQRSASEGLDGGTKVEQVKHPLVAEAIINEKQNAKPAGMSPQLVKTSLSPENKAGAAVSTSNGSPAIPTINGPDEGRKEEKGHNEETGQVLGEIDALFLQVDKDIQECKRRSFIEDMANINEKLDQEILANNVLNGSHVQPNGQVSVNGHQGEESGHQTSLSIPKIEVPSAQDDKALPDGKEGNPRDSWITEISDTLRGKRNSASSNSSWQQLMNGGSTGDVSLSLTPSKESVGNDGVGQDGAKGEKDLNVMIEEMDDFIDKFEPNNGNHNNSLPKRSTSLSRGDRNSTRSDASSVFTHSEQVDLDKQTGKNVDASEVPSQTTSNEDRMALYCITGSKEDGAKGKKLEEVVQSQDSKGKQHQGRQEAGGEQVATITGINQPTRQPGAKAMSQPKETVSSALPKQPESRKQEEKRETPPKSPEPKKELKLPSSADNTKKSKSDANPTRPPVIQVSQAEEDTDKVHLKVLKPSKGARLYASMFKRNKHRKESQESGAGSSGVELTPTLGSNTPDLIHNSESTIDSDSQKTQKKKKKKGFSLSSIMSRGKKSKKESVGDRDLEIKESTEEDAKIKEKEKSLNKYGKLRSSGKHKNKSK